MLREFQDGMKARVVISGEESDPFEVLAGVKQGMCFGTGYIQPVSGCSHAGLQE